MTKLTKNRKAALEKVEEDKLYTLKEASVLVKELTTTKFDASIDLDVRLGIDPRKSNQMVRGVVSLPHGTGKETRVLVLCSSDKEAEAKEAGADFVGLDDFIEKIKGGWTDMDVIITMPSVIGKVAFEPQKIAENAKEFISMVNKLKPAAAKGTYIRSLFLSSTMSPGIKIDPKGLDD